jgi:hypothetical protein
VTPERRAELRALAEAIADWDRSLWPNNWDTFEPTAEAMRFAALASPETILVLLDELHEAERMSARLAEVEAENSSLREVLQSGIAVAEPNWTNSATVDAWIGQARAALSAAPAPEENQ